MIKKYIFIVLVLLVSCNLYAQGDQAILTSPDGKVKVQLSATGSFSSLLSYSVSYEASPLILRGKVGVKLQDEPTGQTSMPSFKTSSVNKTWKQVYGEKHLIKDHYQECVVTFRDGVFTKIIRIRAYNEGMAYQYELVSDKPISLIAELSDFEFIDNPTAWATSTAQGVYEAKRINDIKQASERPLTIKFADNLYGALGEAGLVDFARMKLINTGDRKLGTVLSSPVKFDGVLKSPWRYLLIGKTPGQLLEKNYLTLNLNEPCAIKNTKWIKPGKVIRENSLTTAGSFEVIDFAAKHQIEYMSFDAGWYGREDRDTSDATRVMIDPVRSKGPLDLQRVIAYAKSKNIGILLYVNRRALERQLDTLLPLYKKWGIKGIKFGFVQVGSQQWTSWLHEAVRKCAKYGMLVDIHDEYRPTGYSRTYPNLLTQEGIRGDEETVTNQHTLTTLFTRMLAGAADNTNTYFTKRVDKMGSHASQMAKAVCLYSPLQFLYWYDRPENNNNKTATEGVIRDVPELTFYDRLPTVWDDTRVLEGEIGRYATVARQSGKEWYIGSLTGEEEHHLTLIMTMLIPGKTYTAQIYSDDPSVGTETRVKIETKQISSRDSLVFKLKKNNGLAIRITPNDQ